MSLERREFNDRAHTSVAAEPLPVTVTWDERASHRALVQAQSIAARDPEASQYLAGQVLAQSTPPAIHAYDPPRIYAEMLLAAQLKPKDINDMHYTHFFGLRREIILAKERARQALEDPASTYDATQEY